jgi:hypothetical protein
MKQGKEAARVEWPSTYIDEVADIIPACLLAKPLIAAMRSRLTLQSLAWASPSSCR